MPEYRLEFDDRLARDHTVQSLLETRAELFGDDPFLYYGHDGSEVTFEEVNTTANAIANSLNRLGVEKGQKVSMMVENKRQGALLMFGVHKSGAVFAPINNEFKGSVLTHQLEDLDPEVLVVEDQFLDRFNAVVQDLSDPPHVVVYDTGGDDVSLDDSISRSSFDELLDGDSANPDVSVEWDDPLAILYTSGTTGHPKGVVVPNRWVIYYCAARWQIFNREDVVHTSLPLYHGAGPYWDIVPALVTGASVALWNRFSPNEFFDRVNEYEATTVTLISVMNAWLMDQPERADDHRNTLNKVQLSPLYEDYEEMASRFAFDFITCKFGQQESGNPLTGLIHIAADEDATPADLWRGLPAEEVVRRAREIDIPVSEGAAPDDGWIGGQTEWMEVDIVNDRDESVEPGEIGEIVVRPREPAVIFTEYYNRPEKTLSEFGNLWFHVGDAAYRDEDGNYFYVDRIGNIIRRRGENISSEQVESIIGKNDDVAQVAVFPVEAQAGGEDEIAAVIRLADGVELSIADLRSSLEPRMPAFMIPDHIRFAEAFPTTETNKIRKNELREQFFES